MEGIYENNEEIIADFGSPGFLPVVSMTELYNSVYESKPPIVDGLLYPGTYLFVGSPKYGKSFLMLADFLGTPKISWTHRFVMYLHDVSYFLF